MIPPHATSTANARSARLSGLPGRICPGCEGGDQEHQAIRLRFWVVGPPDDVAAPRLCLDPDPGCYPEFDRRSSHFGPVPSLATKVKNMESKATVQSGSWSCNRLAKFVLDAGAGGFACYVTEFRKREAR